MVGTGCLVAVGSAVGVAQDVAVGCAVVVGKAVDVGRLVAAGLVECGMDWAGAVGDAESGEVGELPGSQPFAAASSNIKPSAIPVSNAPNPAPRRIARDSRPATSAARCAAHRFRI